MHHMTVVMCLFINQKIKEIEKKRKEKEKEKSKK